MNIIWGNLILISLLIGILNGKAAELTTTILESSELAITTCIKIFGTIAVWSGIMKIAEKSGVMAKLQVLSYPIIKLLFPELKKNSPAIKSIALNITANIIGLGNIATPLGIQAMKELQKENPNKEKLSKSMRTLLILNMSSIQLIPTTIIGLRTSYNSQNPTEVVLPILIASLTATTVGLLLASGSSRSDTPKRHTGDVR